MCALKLASHEAKAIAAELHGSTIDLDAEEPAAEPASKVRRTAAKSSAAGQRMFEKVLFFFAEFAFPLLWRRGLSKLFSGMYVYLSYLV